MQCPTWPIVGPENPPESLGPGSSTSLCLLWLHSEHAGDDILQVSHRDPSTHWALCTCFTPARGSGAPGMIETSGFLWAAPSSQDPQGEEVHYLPSRHGHPIALWSSRDSVPPATCLSLWFCVRSFEVGAERGCWGVQLAPDPGGILPSLSPLERTGFPCRKRGFQQLRLRKTH